MTHQQILDKLAAKHLVQSINEDLSRLGYFAVSDLFEIQDIIQKMFTNF